MRTKALALIALFAAALLLAASMAPASVFDTISFEQSEGYAAPAAVASTAGGAMDNIGTGGDFTNTNYGGGSGSWMLVWNGVHSDGTNYGVASGQSAFFFDSNQLTSYARTSAMAVPNERIGDRYFTIDYSSLVTFATIAGGTNNVPPSVRFWFNSATTTPYVQVYHTYAGDNNGKYNITLNVNGTNYFNIGQYQYRQWASEQLIVDRVLGTVAYYYNGSSLGSYNIGTMASFQTYGMSCNSTQKRGQIAVDNIRFGTEAPEPASLIALFVGVTGLIPAIRRRRK